MSIYLIRKMSYSMKEKKPINYQSPDLSKLQGVAVDHKTTIYIPLGADPERAKNRYLYQMNSKYIKNS